VGRRLGQHFLTDPTILDRIVAAIDPRPNDMVIEVGPGRGSLTRRLALRVGQVIAIERDAGLVARLKGAGSGERGADAHATRVMPDNVRVLTADALKLDWHAELKSLAGPSAPRSPLPAPRSESPVPSFKVVGNIPYHITSPLIDKALSPPLPRVIVFLVQREVAERLCAPAGTKSYGALTVGVRSVANVERLMAVRAGSFTPPPQVESALVRIKPRAEPLVPHEDIPGFRSFTVAVFSQRRKQLRRILRSIRPSEVTRIEIELRQLGIDPTTRPERLAPEEMYHVYRVLGR
jgi:16S rRNA (adenine1518-N6/adenine1519-N6)-dimethyltransferase